MKKKWTASFLAFLLALSILAGCSAETTSQPDISAEPSQSTTVDTPDPEQEVNPDVTEGDPEDQPQEPDGNEQETGSSAPASGHELEPSGVTFTLSSVPAYSGSAYVAVNGNVPYFTADDLTTTSFESYSSLDSLGRCGVAYACVGQDIMPTEDRGSIGQVKPTGWHTVKYDCVDGKCLYNRCHLLGYQLTGENSNEENLITGTRYLNIEGMLPFENMVADYSKLLKYLDYIVEHDYYRMLNPIYPVQHKAPPVKGTKRYRKQLKQQKEKARKDAVRNVLTLIDSLSAPQSKAVTA